MSDVLPQSATHDYTIDRRAAQDLVRGRHGAPFEVLGPHALPSGEETVVRAFLPGAHAAWLVLGPQSSGGAIEEAGDRIAMQRIHPEGLFAVVVTQPRETLTYAIAAEYGDGSVRRTRDPYAFAPLLSDYDLYLLGEGTHYESYERLGAHTRSIDGVPGVSFAVWAPNARRVSIVGDFNGWDERLLPMRPRTNGIWELFVPDLAPGTLYKYAVLSWNADYHVLKADPYAFAAEVRPGTASRVWDLQGYAWSDEAWLRARAEQVALQQPMSIYELHVGSWRPNPGTESHAEVTYRELAHQVVPYLNDLGYTHVELMPIAEHPFDGSWGYQITGYFAPTSRFGTPQDFMYFVDYCHTHGIGVLLDWVPAHFPKDEHGLNYFDGSHLYEHADPRQGEHPDWGTLVFNFGRTEVCNFLLANALFWLDKYHIDGLRVDAVASMLYLDYSRQAGEWLPNKYGGRENLDAIDFLRRFNELVHGRFPGAMTIAEESTAWPLVSRPTYVGGLGFTLKWNMGWMHDILEYFAHDPIHRRFHHNALTFSMMYAFSENFVLPFSHDEVVHVKGSMLNKMPGDVWQKFANLRALYAYMFAHPGKKLMFMGDEFGQWAEWNYAGWLQWYLLGPAGDAPSLHAQLQTLVRDLHALLCSSPALYEVDFEPTGFEWIDCNDADSGVISFLRMPTDRQDIVVVVCNFTPVARYGYRVGVPVAGIYTEVLNTDAAVYGGSNVGNMGSVVSEPIAAHGRSVSLSLTLPPLATLVLRPSKPAIASDDVRVTASALAQRDETEPTTTAVRDGASGASARPRTSSRRQAERAADTSAATAASADDQPPQVRQRGRGAKATHRPAQRSTRREASSEGAVARRTRPTT